MHQKFTIVWGWVQILLIVALLIWAGAYLYSNKTVVNLNNEPAANVIVSSPQPNELIKSPYKISGQARGTWFFEASFPIILVNEKGEELGRIPAQATSDWMTTDFVPFEAEMVFDPKNATTGEIIFKKDNPSGLPENDAEVRFPVKFQ